MEEGKFVISLDFELYWGVRDVIKLDDYKKHLSGVRNVIPALLDLFDRYSIHATFAAVGFLFASSKDELLQYLPKERPSYSDSNLSPYESIIHLVGSNEEKDPYHFASDLLNRIRSAGQEIGSHTFSHYYCLQPGQTPDQFRADLQAAIKIAKSKNVIFKSFVFPRNLYDDPYLNILANAGINAYRGNQKSFMYNYKLAGKYGQLQRLLRILDSYINLSGHNTYSARDLSTQLPVNIPASMLLRPFSPHLKIVENIRLKRILKSMTYAAKNNQVFHLWWHPHNFGIHQKENFNFLEKILSHYSMLNEKYGFQSINMRNLSSEISRINE